MAIAKASGFGLCDLLNVPDHVYDAVVEQVQRESRKAKSQAMKERLRSRKG